MSNVDELRFGNKLLKCSLLPMEHKPMAGPIGSLTWSSVPFTLVFILIEIAR